jgi:hypothetical protein
MWLLKQTLEELEDFIELVEMRTEQKGASKAKLAEYER